ncbi:MAG: YjjW family glycine radical enzyme activase [Acidimicrobiia bacterium]|nr:YjjW family glycine radical enzyme activase [Acidimicrobiia bacterium]MDH4306781.1 YjjW family glycine radical enzyme activase [Acidimicrobiia bacterium]
MILAPAGTISHPIEPRIDVFEVAGVVRSSFVDGPGNRYVLFLQGCNFDCTACHNPSTIGRCDGCAVCVDVCPHTALAVPVAGRILFDPSACDQCGDCRTVCPISADPTIRLRSVDAVLTEIRTVAPFVRGVTVTGGEPTLQLGALKSLFSRMGADPELGPLTRLVDTNGSLAPAGWHELLPVLDGAMVDLKSGTPQLHRRITRSEQSHVVASLHLLADAGKLAEVRLLLIEGVTDTDVELEAWARIVTAVDPGVSVRVMPFRHEGTRTAAREWPITGERAIERVVDRLRDLGLTGPFGA